MSFDAIAYALSTKTAIAISNDSLTTSAFKTFAIIADNYMT
jgi:hypothetical protein